MVRASLGRLAHLLIFSFEKSVEVGQGQAAHLALDWRVLGQSLQFELV